MAVQLARIGIQFDGSPFTQLLLVAGTIIATLSTNFFIKKRTQSKDGFVGDLVELRDMDQLKKELLSTATTGFVLVHRDTHKVSIANAKAVRMLS